MTNFIGFLLPPLIDLINRKIKDSDLRFWTSVAICTVIGFIISFFNHGNKFLIGESFEAAMVIFGQAQLTYRAVYENSRFREENDLKAPNS